MTQSEVLNTALQYLLDSGAEAAYSYLNSNYTSCDEPYGVSVYGLRVSMAIRSGLLDEALEIMNEAVMEKGLWFRPEFFDDEVLAPVWKTEIYKKCRHKSDRLYTEARQKSKMICTWNRVRANRILIALHGNGQNLDDSKALWAFSEELGWQAEYIQSKEPDIVGKFRWDDHSAATYQIEAFCGNLGWHDYDERALVGYGSGCNLILRAINGGMLECERILLVAPHIPMLDEESGSLYKMLASVGTVLTVFCDGSEYGARLVREAVENGVEATLVEADGADRPDRLAELAKPYLE